ncbi:hypothetical protein [Dethiosulfovibrio peptidovorans]|uniref:hypothetical protein n=1 Tax=Dethiosulfovibrio peptidovorans TaxID=47055 RepID=UPI000591152F|nr:hypothetical protein [Dethiosulfovibrio peptidovorans]
MVKLFIENNCRLLSLSFDNNEQAVVEKNKKNRFDNNDILKSFTVDSPQKNISFSKERRGVVMHTPRNIREIEFIFKFLVAIKNKKKRDAVVNRIFHVHERAEGIREKVHIIVKINIF